MWALTYIVALGPTLIESPACIFESLPACLLLGWLYLPGNLLNNLAIHGSSSPEWLRQNFIIWYWAYVLSLQWAFLWKRRWIFLTLLGIILLFSAKGCMKFAVDDFNS